MKKKNKNAFTLVELLAVIVILAIILVIAVPKVMSVIEDAKKATLESTVKMIASQAEKQKVQNTVLGNEETITCKNITNINDVDYASCEIDFEDNTAKVTIIGSGKFEGLYVCNGTKTEATATNEECETSGGSVETGVSFLEGLLAEEETKHNGLVQTYVTVNGQQVDAGIRYAGARADVKNKVYFNCAETDGTNTYGTENYNYESSCEIWRIIGIFDTKSTDSETEDAIPRIKIVRDEVLSTQMSWDTNADGVDYINQWGETTLSSDDTTIYPGASLKQYLNDGESSYYNSLTSIAKGQIDNALWYTGAVAKDTASGVYEDERSNATGTGEAVNYTTTWVGKIGLIYISDFGYAGTNCGDYTIYDYANANSCGKTSNWLTPSSGTYWTISPLASNSDLAWGVYSGGYAGYDYRLYRQIGVRPAAYLSSNIQIIGGDGSTVPYKLK